jgi:hypothetical protein
MRAIAVPSYQTHRAKIMEPHELDAQILFQPVCFSLSRWLYSTNCFQLRTMKKDEDVKRK